MRPWWLRVVEQTDPSYASSREASLLETLLKVPNLTASFYPQAAVVKATPPPPGRLLGRDHAQAGCLQALSATRGLLGTSPIGLSI